MLRTAQAVGLLAALAAAVLGVASAASTTPVALPFARLAGAGSGDGAGTALAIAGDVNGDGHADVIVGAPDARTAPGRRGGAAYVVFGPFAPGQEIDLGNLGARGFAIRASREGRGWLAGLSVAGAGDVDGDGLADVVVGAPGVRFPETTQRLAAPGHAYVVFGRRRSRDVSLASLGARGIAVTGAAHGFPDAFGFKVAGAGDVDGDGLADVAVGAPGNPGGESGGTDGSAYVVFGRRTGASFTTSRLGRHGFRIAGGSELAGINSIAAAGDWNRDGRDDVAITAGNAREGEGAIYVVHGRRYARDVDVARLGSDGVLIRGGRGGPPYRFVGAGLAGGADVTGDGRPDLVAGLAQDGPGRVWIVAGTRSSATIRMFPASSRARVAAVGRNREWGTGASLALGRIDDDARADVVLLANGRPYVVYGRRSAPAASLASLTPAQGFAVDASQEPVAVDSEVKGAAGFTTVAAGDLTGDGRAEIVAGSNRATHLGRERAGAAYVFFPR